MYKNINKNELIIGLTILMSIGAVVLIATFINYRNSKNYDVLGASTCSLNQCGFCRYCGGKDGETCGYLTRCIKDKDFSCKYDISCIY